MTELDRRTMLSVTALTAIVPVAGGRAAEAGKTWPSGAVTTLPDREALRQALHPAADRFFYLAEAGREGLFRCVEGPAPTPADPLQGLSVPSATPGFFYIREWDGIHGRPEWFGARTNDSAFDCADAIEACYALCPVTELAQADYGIHRTLHFQKSWRTVRGLGSWGTGQERGTRIVLEATAPDLHTADILIVGAAEKPSSEAEMVTENHLSNFTLVRDGACTPHPSGDITRYPTGLRASYLMRCRFLGITSLESSVGFYIGGVVYTKFDDCFAQRLHPGMTKQGDRWVGYYLNGHISFGYAGGNASLYMNRCVAADQNGAHADPMGLQAVGAFVDSFIDHFESARIDTGIAISADGARGFGQTIDLHIRNAVLDGCGKSGIDIDLDATSSAAVEIVDPYVASGGRGGLYGIAVRDGAGLVTITGGQVHGDFSGGSLYFNRTRAIRVQGTKIEQSNRPVVVGEASGLILEPQISNYAMTSPNFAILCENLTRSIVRPVIIGAAGPAFVGGVSLGLASNHCQIDGTAIDPGCFSAPDPRYKIWFAGRDARGGEAGGAFLGAGNILTGVTG